MDWIAKKRSIVPDSDSLDQGPVAAMETQGPTVHLDQYVDPNPTNPSQETVSQTAPPDIHDVPQENVHHCVDVVNAVQHEPVDVDVDTHSELSESESSSDTESENLPALPIFPVKPENHCFNIACLKPEIEVPDGLKKCTRCKFATYCSRECQAQHWKMHKAGCGKISSGEL